MADQLDSVGKTTSPEKLVGALVSGLKVLRFLAAAKTPLGVSRIARELDLNPSTCFNILKTLAYEELVNFDEATKTYSTGLGLLALAKGALDQASYISMIRPHLQDIAQQHGVTATLWHVTQGERVVLVERADNDAAIRVYMSLGQRLPMYIAALGRCFAAYSELSRSELRARFSRLRWETELSFEQYLQEVEDVKKRGYAVDYGYYVKGVTTVSAAVLDNSSRPLMAISVTGFSAQLEQGAIEDLGEDLRNRAVAISQAMTGVAAFSPQQ